MLMQFIDRIRDDVLLNYYLIQHILVSNHLTYTQILRNQYKMMRNRVERKSAMKILT